MATAIRSVLVLDNLLTAAGTQEEFTTTRPFVVLEVVLVPTAAVAMATMTLQRQPAAGGGFAALTDAMACAVVSTVARAATIVEAQLTFAVNDQLRFLPSGAGVNGRTRVFIAPTAIAGAG